MKDKWYIRIKRRIDQGRNYAAYVQLTGTALLICKVFGINNKWVYVLMFPVLLFGFWFAGYLHEKFVIEDEQNGYFKLNPGFTEILKQIEKLNEKINKLSGKD